MKPYLPPYPEPRASMGASIGAAPPNHTVSVAVATTTGLGAEIHVDLAYRGLPYRVILHTAAGIKPYAVERCSGHHGEGGTRALRRGSETAVQAALIEMAREELARALDQLSNP